MWQKCLKYPLMNLSRRFPKFDMLRGRFQNCWKNIGLFPWGTRWPEGGQCDQKCLKWPKWAYIVNSWSLVCRKACIGRFKQAYRNPEKKNLAHEIPEYFRNHVANNIFCREMETKIITDHFNSISPETTKIWFFFSLFSSAKNVSRKGQGWSILVFFCISL